MSYPPHQCSRRHVVDFDSCGLIADFDSGVFVGVRHFGARRRDRELKGDAHDDSPGVDASHKTSRRYGHFELNKEEHSFVNHSNRKSRNSSTSNRFYSSREISLVLQHNNLRIQIYSSSKIFAKKRN